jgi:hypothetical protein
MTTRRPTLGLGLGLLVLAGCSASSYEAAATNPCPPSAAIATSPGTPLLAAGGKGVEPRVVQPSVDEGVTPATEQLASGGRGVPPRTVSSSPIGGAGMAPTPHLAAMPRGTGGPRIECR